MQRWEEQHEQRGRRRALQRRSLVDRAKMLLLEQSLLAREHEQREEQHEQRSTAADALTAFKSFSEKGDRRVLPPSPVTPAYVKAMAEKRVNSNDKEVQDACRSFENYLVEMIVEGKIKDLTDVEELLYCWKNLKCSVFIDLVSRFHGELCKDLFSPDSTDESSNLITPFSIC